ncbi:hypothetical protein ACFS5M_05760 [Lacinutrix iliipiscaria]|uniref:Lipoprotein n=1 Tax=Lacinutrix iliipiscaria TaxID=1230532 RepID=A0ABW5WPM0_9FLAO
MRSIFFKTSFLCFCVTLFHCNKNDEEYFQGKIIYKYHYTSDSLNADSLNLNRIRKSIFQFNLNNYQSTFIDNDTTTYFYISKINKCLIKINSNLQQECEDYSLSTDSILHFKVYDTDEKILGHNCQVLEFQGKYFWNKYYVSKDVKIAPSTYRKHEAYNWKFYGEKVDGGMILKLEHRFKNFTMYGEALLLSNLNTNERALQITPEEIASVCN